MKKLFCAIFLFVSLKMFSDAWPYSVYIDCYRVSGFSNKLAEYDTIPLEEVLNLKEIKLESNNIGQVVKYKVISYTLSINLSSNKMIFNEISNNITEGIKSGLQKIENNSGMFLDVKVQITDSRNQIKYDYFKGYVIVGKSNKKCNKTIVFKGKLFTGVSQLVPVSNQSLLLKDDYNKTLASTVTDRYGDFEFKDINVQSNYNIEVPNVAEKIKEDKLYIANQDGTNKREMKKNGATFSYRLLPVEMVRLSEMKEEDTELTLQSFNKSNNTQLSVLKDIQYASNSFEITPEAQKILNGIVKSLKDNPKLKLSIISHTDSKGDDASNKILSEKRANMVMNYLINAGVSKNRISAQGKGESNILNRCANNVDCSEAEHKINRRTEFLFTK